MDEKIDSSSKMQDFTRCTGVNWSNYNLHVTSCKFKRMSLQKNMRRHVDAHISRGDITSSCCGFCGLTSCGVALIISSGKGKQHR